MRRSNVVTRSRAQLLPRAARRARRRGSRRPAVSRRTLEPRGAPPRRLFVHASRALMAQDDVARATRRAAARHLPVWMSHDFVTGDRGRRRAPLEQRDEREVRDDAVRGSDRLAEAVHNARPSPSRDVRPRPVDRDRVATASSRTRTRHVARGARASTSIAGYESWIHPHRQVSRARSPVSPANSSCAISARDACTNRSTRAVHLGGLEVFGAHAADATATSSSSSSSRKQLRAGERVTTLLRLIVDGFVLASSASTRLARCR